MDESENTPFHPPESGPEALPDHSSAPEAAPLSESFELPESLQSPENESLTIVAREIPDPLRTPDSPRTTDAPRTPNSPSSPDSPPAPDSPPSRAAAAQSSQLPPEISAQQGERFGFVQPGTVRSGLLRLEPPPTQTKVPKPRAIFITAALLILTLMVWFAASRAGWLAPDPSEVARAQLLDLDQGRWRAAYDLFSPRYREQVSFEVWREMVLMHSRMFRTRELHFADNREWNGGAALEAHLVAESGDRYLARFMLVYEYGHWWVDDLHWDREPDIPGQVRI